MPNHGTSTRGLLWEVLAPILRWPLRSRTRLLGCLAVVVLVVLALGALGDEKDNDDTAPAASSSTTSNPSSPSSSSSASEGRTSSTSTSSSTTTDQAVPEEPGLTAQQRREGKPAVTRAGRLADRLVANRDEPQATWWRRIKGDLSASGQSQMRALGPKGLPFTKVTGDAGLVVTEADALGDRYTSVAVPTNQGTYLFLVEDSGVSSISEMLPDAEADAEIEAAGA